MVAMHALLHDVEELLRHVADEEILSRFGKLDRHEIHTKHHAGDVVTTADLEAEYRLTEGLTKLIPSSTVIGEEECFRKPETLDHLKDSGPVWTVDPLDGTGNFAKGKPCFAMICALMEGGQTQMGWIFDPVAGVCATAQRGHGVFVGGQRRMMENPGGPHAMTGSLGDSLRKRLQPRIDAEEEGLPRHLVRYHCCGREYLDLLVGKLHFALYGGRLMPWDHAAGGLMVEEACGYGRICKDKSPYAPAVHGSGEHLLVSTDENSFDILKQMLFNDKANP